MTCECVSSSASVLMSQPGQVTRLLERLNGGEQDAADELLPLVYDELHEIAQRSMSGERAGHAFDATDLLHEAYLRLVDPRSKSWANRRHFLGVASRAMRNILVDHARARKATKRGGGDDPVTLDEAVAAFEQEGPDLVELDRALERLASFDAGLARIVELHFFGGLTFDQVAEVVGIPVRTLYRQWWMARAWLRNELDTELG